MENEIIRLNILKEYDVHWSLDFIIRDFIQNYFDSTREFPAYNFDKDVKIFVDYRVNYASVSGKIEFNWENLKYIGGTTKQDKSNFAGGFGEGFLIATLCLLKMKPHIRISQKIGNIELIPFFENQSGREELCFEKRVLPDSKRITGSILSFAGCDPDFLNKFSQGKDYFNFPQNSMFKELIYQDLKNGVEIYTCDDRCGRVFYRYQDRGAIVLASSKKTVPFVVCYNNAIGDIPNTRDRIDLNQAEKNRIFEKTLSGINDINAIKTIIAACKPDWQDGNIILKHVADSARNIVKWDWTTCEATPVIYQFPDHLVADDDKWDFYSEKSEIKAMIKRQGYLFCNEYMKYLGMKSFEKMAGTFRDLLKAEKFRSPTLIELSKFNLIYDFYELLTNSTEERKSLSIFVSEIRKGEYSSSVIHLNENIFYSFSDFTATLLHEISHKKGYDNSSKFSEMLTVLMQLLLQNPTLIVDLKRKWDQLHEQHLTYNNMQISEALLMLYDVQIHKIGCICEVCEKRKFKSYGIGIFNADYIRTDQDFNNTDPVHVIYADNINLAFKQAEKYCRQKKWKVKSNLYSEPDFQYSSN